MNNGCIGEFHTLRLLDYDVTNYTTPLVIGDL